MPVPPLVDPYAANPLVDPYGGNAPPPTAQSIDPGENIPFVDENGEVQGVPSHQLAAVPSTWKRVTPEYADALSSAKERTISGPIESFAEGAGEGLTSPVAGAVDIAGAPFGHPDLGQGLTTDTMLQKAGVSQERLHAEKEAHPIAHAVGEFTGALAPIALTLGGAAPEELGTEALAELAPGAAEAALGDTSTITRALHSASVLGQGAAYGVSGDVEEADLGDSQLNGQSLAIHAGMGALLGLGGEAAISLGGKFIPPVIKKVGDSVAVLSDAAKAMVELGDIGVKWAKKSFLDVAELAPEADRKAVGLGELKTAAGVAKNSVPGESIGPGNPIFDAAARGSTEQMRTKFSDAFVNAIDATQDGYTHAYEELIPLEQRNLLDSTDPVVATALRNQLTQKVTDEQVRSMSDVVRKAEAEFADRDTNPASAAGFAKAMQDGMNRIDQENTLNNLMVDANRKLQNVPETQDVIDLRNRIMSEADKLPPGDAADYISRNLKENGFNAETGEGPGLLKTSLNHYQSLIQYRNDLLTLLRVHPELQGPISDRLALTNKALENPVWGTISRRTAEMRSSYEQFNSVKKDLYTNLGLENLSPLGTSGATPKKRSMLVNGLLGIGEGLWNIAKNYGVPRKAVDGLLDVMATHTGDLGAVVSRYAQENGLSNDVVKGVDEIFRRNGMKSAAYLHIAKVMDAIDASQDQFMQTAKNASGGFGGFGDQALRNLLETITNVRRGVGNMADAAGAAVTHAAGATGEALTHAGQAVGQAAMTGSRAINDVLGGVPGEVGAGVARGVAAAANAVPESLKVAANNIAFKANQLGTGLSALHNATMSDQAYRSSMGMSDLFERLSDYHHRMTALDPALINAGATAGAPAHYTKQLVEEITEKHLYQAGLYQSLADAYKRDAYLLSSPEARAALHEAPALTTEDLRTISTEDRFRTAGLLATSMGNQGQEWMEKGYNALTRTAEGAYVGAKAAVLGKAPRITGPVVKAIPQVDLYNRLLSTSAPELLIHQARLRGLISQSQMDTLLKFASIPSIVTGGKTMEKAGALIGAQTGAVLGGNLGEQALGGRFPQASKGIRSWIEWAAEPGETGGEIGKSVGKIVGAPLGAAAGYAVASKGSELAQALAQKVSPGIAGAVTGSRLASRGAQVAAGAGAGGLLGLIHAIGENFRVNGRTAAEAATVVQNLIEGAEEKAAPEAEFAAAIGKKATEGEAPEGVKFVEFMEGGHKSGVYRPTEEPAPGMHWEVGKNAKGEDDFIQKPGVEPLGIKTTSPLNEGAIPIPPGTVGTAEHEAEFEKAANAAKKGQAENEEAVRASKASEENAANFADEESRASREAAYAARHPKTEGEGSPFKKDKAYWTNINDRLKENPQDVEALEALKNAAVDPDVMKAEFERARMEKGIPPEEGAAGKPSEPGFLKKLLYPEYTIAENLTYQAKQGLGKAKAFLEEQKQKAANVAQGARYGAAAGAVGGKVVGGPVGGVMGAISGAITGGGIGGKEIRSAIAPVYARLLPILKGAKLLSDWIPPEIQAGGLYALGVPGWTAYALTRGLRTATHTAEAIHHLAKIGEVARKVSNDTANGVTKMLRSPFMPGTGAAVQTSIGSLSKKKMDFGASAHSVQLKNQTDLQKRAKEIDTLNSNPGLLMHTLAQNTADLVPHAPQTAIAVQQTAHRAVQVLAQALPRNPQPSSLPGQDEWQPSGSQISDFENVYEAVMDPKSVMKHLHQGTITPEALQAASTVYPSWMESLKNEYRRQLVENPKLKLNTHQKFGAHVLFGTDVDPSTSSDQIAFIQNQFQMAHNPQASPSGPRGNTSGMKELSTASMSQTPLQSTEARRNS